MTQIEPTAQIQLEDGRFVGPYRSPANFSADEKGSIHDDKTAQKLGFRGGTVAGSIHMDQFPPILLRVFGERWFETGRLSTYFLNATLHGESVRTIAETPEPLADADVQVRVTMERDDGTPVLEGTASLGSPPEPSELRKRLLQQRKPGELRILEHLRVGTVGEPQAARIEPDESRGSARTEPLPWYSGASPWGGAIASPQIAVHLMRSAERGLDLRRHRAVGLFGAIEVAASRGPIFVDRDYLASAEILALGSTPKTEYLWYETRLSEKTGEEIGSMLMMLRFMKGSSDLW